MIGYAIDGFGIYTLMADNETKATHLDDYGGQVDAVRG